METPVDEPKSVPTITIEGKEYKIDDIPEDVLEKMDDDKQQEYLDLCEQYY